MSVTTSSIITNINTYIGDASTDRVTEVQRLEAITEATAWLLEELGNEHMVETYNLPYFDSVHYYKVTGSVPDLMTGADLRRESDNYYSFARKSPRELSEEIAQNNNEPSWAIERKDDDTYLVVNADPRNKMSIISLTNGLETWVADATTSDSLNIRIDTAEKREGASSVAFDLDVSQSGNNRGTIYNPELPTSTWAAFEDTSNFLLEVFIPDSTYTSSVSIVWGSDTGAIPSTKANYWTSTVTTTIAGGAFEDGWNTVSVPWSTATETGTPDVTDIKYMEITVNYTASQTDDTFYRVNFLRIAKPETLVLHYISWNVGTVSSANSTPIIAFTATTNVPFFSGMYDQYKYPVAQKAASILFSVLRLRDEAGEYDNKAVESLSRFRKNFESSKTREVKSFKVMGVNLRRRNKSGRIR